MILRAQGHELNNTDPTSCAGSEQKQFGAIPLKAERKDYTFIAGLLGERST